MDRQDIDALLIGALYGELTPADEARLAAHLESHPTDRGALDDLKSARAKLRESRFFDVQLDPPQHISALLLQEAHRRAPKRAVGTEGEQRESWFWRFAKSFMLHPAMAAAAMLVVVLGVAGTLYMKKGEHFADREVAPPAAEQQKQLAQGTVATAPEPELATGAGSAAAVDQGAAYQADLAEDEDLKRAEPAKAEAKVAKETASNQKPDPNASAPHGGVAKNKGIAVTTERPQPKDLEDGERAKDRFATGAKGAGESAGKAGKMDLDGADDTGLAGDNYEGTSRRGAGGGGAATGTTTGAIGGAPGGAANTITTTPPRAAGPAPSYAQPPPPPAAAPAANDKATVAKPASPTPAPKPPTAAPSKVATKAEPSPAADAKPTAPTTSSSTSKTDTAKKVATQKPAEKAPAPAPTAPAQDSTLIAWAKGQHAKSISLAKSGDCTAAAKVALAVSNRAPEYYSQYMATDRSLKSCKQYIDAERDKDAEKAAKTRAQKRVNADEAQQAK